MVTGGSNLEEAAREHARPLELAPLWVDMGLGRDGFAGQKNGGPVSSQLKFPHAAEISQPDGPTRDFSGCLYVLPWLVRLS